MSFGRRIFIEHQIKYALIVLIALFLWDPIRDGLLLAADANKLEAIAVIMGIVTLCSLSGYYAFSYTTVSKNASSRFFGYFCTFFLGISILVSLIIIYHIATIWVPEMKGIWALCLFSLYFGTYIFDNLDLSRMGMDVAATSFFENGYMSNQETELTKTISFLKEGHRLPFANNLIGKAIITLGESKNKKTWINAGNWILDNSVLSQKEIDMKVVKTFSPLTKSDKIITDILKALKKGQNQNVADALIGRLLERIDKK
jgi:hypothetical protein